jgi:hypothetical protein
MHIENVRRERIEVEQEEKDCHEYDNTRARGFSKDDYGTFQLAALKLRMRNLFDVKDCNVEGGHSKESGDQKTRSL